MSEPKPAADAAMLAAYAVNLARGCLLAQFEVADMLAIAGRYGMRCDGAEFDAIVAALGQRAADARDLERLRLLAAAHVPVPPAPARPGTAADREVPPFGWPERLMFFVLGLAILAALGQRGRWLP